MTTTVTIFRHGPEVTIVRDETTVVVGGPRVTVQLSRTGSPGPSGTGGYNHNQESASNTWTINHNLGYRPTVALFTVGGVEFDAEVVHTSVNQCTVNLVTPMAGMARLV